jgi:hypothetical protein
MASRKFEYNSLSFKLDDLNQFEKILLSDSNFTKKEIRISFGPNRSKSETMESFSQIQDNPLIPDNVQGLEMNFSGPQNKMSLKTFSDYIRIVISGESKWVRLKSEEIDTFLSKKKTLSYIFHDFAFQFSIFFLGGIILNYILKSTTIYGNFIDRLSGIANNPEDLILLFIFAFWGLIIWRLGKIFPTLQIEIREPSQNFVFRIFGKVMYDLVIGIIVSIIIFIWLLR